MSEEENRELDIGGVILATMMLLAGIFLLGVIINNNYGVTCKISASFNNDTYCNKVFWSDSNRTSDGRYEWVKGSYEEDRLIAEQRQRQQEAWAKLQREKQECHDSGYLVNNTFTLEDYGLNCKKIDYLNDHLMDNYVKVNAGKVEGYYSGIFSHGHLSGEQYAYINERVVATGKLIESINYWVDCNEEKSAEKIDFFTEEEFVMYYVEECID